MKKQSGFTLIELVVVIVILGILAVTAAPRFLSLQSDARAATLQGLKGAMAGASGIVYGKALINGVDGDSTGSATISDNNSNTITIMKGYPTATENGIGNAVTGLNDKNEWKKLGTANVGTMAADTIYYSFANVGDTTATKCYVSYKMGASDSEPTITAASADDC